MSALDYIRSYQERVWTWFVGHAHRPHALVWLGVVAFFDAIFFPIAPEVFLVALVVAHPNRWKKYLSVAIIFSTAGAVAGYFIASFLFHTIGDAVLHIPILRTGFIEARHLIHGHVFWTMAFASFTPIPDKIFILGGGFLGVPFIPFLAGYFLGRSLRMALVTYLAGKYGKHILDLMNRYLLVVGLILLALFIYYGIVHFRPLGL